jgi:isochorismate pyruvate lyase
LLELDVSICRNARRGNPPGRPGKYAAAQHEASPLPWTRANADILWVDPDARMMSQTLPEHCHDMPTLRREIDRLDRALVALLAERQRYIEQAAIIKNDRGRVRDEARIEDVIAKVVAEARRAGLSPAIAEPVWRELVERSIAHEFEAFDAKKEDSPLRR